MGKSLEINMTVWKRANNHAKKVNKATKSPYIWCTQQTRSTQKKHTNTIKMEWDWRKRTDNKKKTKTDEKEMGWWRWRWYTEKKSNIKICHRKMMRRTFDCFMASTLYPFAKVDRYIACIYMRLCLWLWECERSYPIFFTRTFYCGKHK